MALTITVLGCGNSSGVPAVGNAWGVCDPAEPRNRRSRCSLSVRSASNSLVIDTGPDFREQLNREDIRALDAVLYTHAHGDHCNGMDDLRSFAFRNKTLVPVYGSRETLYELEQRFVHLFRGGKSEIYKPCVQPHVLEYGGPYTVGDIAFTTFAQDHGSCVSTGYRFGDFAYSVDLWRLDDAAVAALKGVRTWIVDAAAYKEPQDVIERIRIHANLETIYALNKRIGAAQVYITSLSLAMDYKTLCAELPPGFAPAYDGLVLGVP